MTSRSRVDLDSQSFRPPLAVDSWLSEPFVNHETDVLTRALQLEICNSDSFGVMSSPDVVLTPTDHAVGSHTGVVFASVSSGIKAIIPSPAAGKTSRRKPRKSKKSLTTVINADATNFRQMVQQITGTRCPIVFGGSGSSVFRPEPKRPRTALYDDSSATSSCGVLPTLDTSAFLLNQAGLAHPEQFPDAGVSVPETPSPLLDFGPFPSTAFPTLESWSHPFVSFINQSI